MADPPRGDHHLGRFAGYAAANRVRRRILIVFALAAAGSVVAYREYSDYLAHRYAHPFELPPDTDIRSRPRELHWSEGEARLGLSRNAPSIAAIVLPDKIIRLAPGCEHAQVRVNVINGHTVGVETLVGEIVEVPRPVDAPSPSHGGS
ncbi:MAG: hypothetical protein B7733_08105 [Myxococcales bacterium FL481]|nr:MAG: hypothetical protein B7733_08105 [Myxococcales bacterium FL481]